MKLASLAAAILFATPAAAQDVGTALDALRRNSHAAHSDTLLVIRDGRVLIDENSNPAADPLIEMMSATKSVVAIAVMKAIDEGAIANLDVPVHHWYPEWKQGAKAAITLRMLLNHSSGLQHLATTADIYPAPDFVQLALAADLEAKPGTRASYNNKATNLLAGIIERATGLKLDSYMQARLFAPLGIKGFRWTRDRAGNPHGMAGLQIAAADIGRLGQLVLDRGRWRGNQLIRADLIDAMLARGSPLSDQFGLLWYRTPAWVRYTVDAASMDRLRATGLDEGVIGRVRPLAGRRFETRSAMSAALREHLGADGLPRWGEAMIGTGNSPDTIFTREEGPVVAYSAQGYLGQAIVVIPSARIVAVRQYRSRATPPPTDSYPALIEDLIALTENSAGARGTGATP